MGEAELRYGAKTENEQPQLLAIEMASAAESPFRALRIMKSFAGDYLSIPLEKASTKFWQMLFPLPYKDEVFESARARGLDPYYVAGLIRQESEFNPVAKSRANAYGLMQLLPSTGRMLGRKDGMSAVSASLLLNPAVSIRLGTQYLRGQLDSWDGDWYRTLAAYNAGPGRVHQWLSWANFREPVEFIESIPFNETREYVQAVLRNADIYRQLYSGKRALDSEPKPKTSIPLQLAALMKPVEPYHAASSPAATAAKKTSVTAKRAGATRKTVASRKAVGSKPAAKRHAQAEKPA
jgi:soluble lytic murein transglycosylase